MARRLPSPPPTLPGFSYVHILGSGGFADVFLYEQNMPRRQVAVKVMLSEVVNDQVRQMFRAEANLMAQLSSHPAILTVYEASVSADGRPYLVMELCSATLSERYRRERIPVGEVLRIAVKIGSAVETAHRAGVLHRDIKPSNILTTAYGHPVLSDFGIASTLTTVSEEDSVGLSVPWSAPEVLLDETPGTIASEVWALAATVYSLLAGRSPFEDPGGSNSSSDLMGRIARAKPQPIGRPDVPASLEQLLRRAMSRRPEQRPASALELVRELQAIEAELGLPQTQIEVAREDWALGTVSDLEDRTRLRPLPGGAGMPAPRRRRRSAAATATTCTPRAPSSAHAPGRAGLGARARGRDAAAGRAPGALRGRRCSCRPAGRRTGLGATAGRRRRRARRRDGAHRRPGCLAGRLRDADPGPARLPDPARGLLARRSSRPDPVSRTAPAARPRGRRLLARRGGPDTAGAARSSPRLAVPGSGEAGRSFV
jgi:tRNA A-37 threonylcarbamoyl transferase component Bud32